jgi:hypothetical protein
MFTITFVPFTSVSSPINQWFKQKKYFF